MNHMVSIIIPVYNRPFAVMNAIQSVANQDYDNWEIILVDDGSESREYQNGISDKRIRIINNKTNRGVAYSRNVGIHNASGDYIMFLDSDNTIEANCLSEMIQCIEYSKSQAVFSLWTYVLSTHQDA